MDSKKTQRPLSCSDFPTSKRQRTASPSSISHEPRLESQGSLLQHLLAQQIPSSSVEIIDLDAENEQHPATHPVHSVSHPATEVVVLDDVEIINLDDDCDANDTQPTLHEPPPPTQQKPAVSTLHLFPATSSSLQTSSALSPPAVTTNSGPLQGLHDGQSVSPRLMARMSPMQNSFEQATQQTQNNDSSDAQEQRGKERTQHSHPYQNRDLTHAQEKLFPSELSQVFALQNSNSSPHGCISIREIDGEQSDCGKPHQSQCIRQNTNSIQPKTARERNNLAPSSQNMPFVSAPVSPFSRVHVTHGGSLYRENDDGIEIIDSDEEDELVQNNNLFSSQNGPSTAPLPSQPAPLSAPDNIHSHAQSVTPTSTFMHPHPSGLDLFFPLSSAPMSSAARISSDLISFAPGSQPGYLWKSTPQSSVHFQNNTIVQHPSSDNYALPRYGPTQIEPHPLGSVPLQHSVHYSLPSSESHAGNPIPRAVEQLPPDVAPSFAPNIPSTIPNGSEETNGGLTDYGLRTLVKQHGLTADADKEADTPSEMTINLMPHQKRALEWMTKRERPMDLGEDVVAADDECLGGILADEQGLGKTLTMISVMLKNTPQLGMRNGVRTVDDRPLDDGNDYLNFCESQKPPWRTLVVCPLSLMHQWRHEISSNIRKEDRPTICIYHGPKRDRDTSTLKHHDIIITTYSTLANEYPKVLKDLPENQLRKKANLQLIRRKSGPLFCIHWRRVVLDEAHYVRNRNTENWKAVMSLKADMRWCLTGTPIANSVDDIYSLFCFVRYNFVPSYEMWNQRWKKRLESPSEYVRKRAFSRFQTICGVVVLRRTKKDTINGKLLLNLPNREIHLVHCDFDKSEERATYNNASLNTMETLNAQLQCGPAAMTYSSVFVMLLRLRQACCHPFLEEYSRMIGRHEKGRIDKRYATPYSVEELEEAIELAEGQQSLLDMLDESVRVRIERSLLPPEKQFGVVWGPFKCNGCGGERRWEQGMFFACGDQFCGGCCERARIQGRCLRCANTVGKNDGSDTEINANELRMEIHARAILGDGNLTGVGISGCEIREWVKEEVKRRQTNRLNNPELSTVNEGPITIDMNDDLEIGNSSSPSGNTGLNANREIVSGGNGRSSNIVEKRKRKLLTLFSMQSTKIRRIVDELNRLRDEKLGEKTLIFSQWTTMLDIVEFHVQVNGHATCRIDGTMTIGEREAQIDEFKRSEEKNILLISLHSGGTGLNLTAASRVIMVDVWWNPFVEQQAIDRVHRIGQNKTVHVTKFKLKNTVEERIYAICAAKQTKASGALGESSSRSLGRQKLSMTELLGIFREEAEHVANVATPGSAAAAAAENILQMGSPFPHPSS